MRRITLWWMGAALLFDCSAASAHGARCTVWRSKVDPSLSLQGRAIAELPSDRDAVAAIACLLESRGDTRPARFSGAMDERVSQTFDRATIEVAALYFISFIYEKKWDHGMAVAIDGPDGVNTDKTIRDAYAAYRRWFVKVKRYGIADCRKRGIAPLRGTSLAWYGKAPLPMP